LNRTWGIHKNRSFLRNQLVSLGLIFVCGALALASLMLTALNQQSFEMGVLPRWLQRFAGHGFVLFSVVIFKIAAIPLGVLILFIIYRFLPNGRPPLRRVIPAAIGVGLFLELGKYVSTLAWPYFQLKLSREYGVFQYSASLIFLSFFASLLVLGGAEWAARGHRFDGHSLSDMDDEVLVKKGADLSE